MRPESFSPVEAGSPLPLKDDRASTASGAFVPAQLRTVRWATAAWCAALVAALVIVKIERESGSVAPADSFWTLLHRQVASFGYAAVALALMTLPFGLFYGRGLAARLKVAPQARAMHMAISLSALATIALHIAALWSGYPPTVHNARVLLLPFAYGGESRFPYPIASGVLGFWLIVLLGLSYFARKLIGGARRWRILHRLVAAGLVLSVVHVVYLSGYIPGWGD